MLLLLLFLLLAGTPLWQTGEGCCSVVQGFVPLAVSDSAARNRHFAAGFCPRRRIASTLIVSMSDDNDDDDDDDALDGRRNDKDVVVARPKAATTTAATTTAAVESFQTPAPRKKAPSETTSRKPSFQNSNQRQSYSNNNRNSNPNAHNKNKTFNKNVNNNNNNNSHRVLNQALVKAESAAAVLQLLQKYATLQSKSAGASLNSVNFSTALHRLARHATTTTTNNNNNNNNNGVVVVSDKKFDRAQTLSDPRTALLLASIAEAMVENPHQMFQARELANMAWALAKLKLAPPYAAMPPHLSTATATTIDEGDSSTTTATTTTAPDAADANGHRPPLPPGLDSLAAAAATVRQTVLEVARERAAVSSAGEGSSNRDSVSSSAQRWIPVVSQLAGHLLDAMGESVLRRANTDGPSSSNAGSSNSNSQNSPSTKPVFQMQEWSNLLWAWATAGRGDEKVFGVVIRNMIQQQTEKLQHPMNNQESTERKKTPVELGLLRPQEWSNAVWAVATAQCYDSYDDLLVHLAKLMEENADFVNSFKSQELSNTVWGVATLLSNKKEAQTLSAANRQNGSPFLTKSEQQAALTILRQCLTCLVQKQAQGFRTQELTNTIWAAATLGFGLTTSSTSASWTEQYQPQQQRLNNYVILNSENPVADARLMVEAVNTVGVAALQQLPQFWSQELNNLAWALARLLSDDSNVNVIAASSESSRATVQALLRGIGLQLLDPRRAVKSQDVGTTLWALATLEFHDEKIYRGVASRLSTELAHQYKPQELSNSIWAFATAEIEAEEVDVFDTSLVPGLQQPGVPTDPVTICFAAAAQELMRRPHQFKSQEIKDVLWSFSKVGIRHPLLFKSVSEHLVGSEDGLIVARGLDEFSPQGLGNMAWAFARQGQLAEGVSDRWNLNSGNGRLLVYKTIYFDVGQRLLQKLFGAIAETNLRVHDELRKAKPQDISNTAWAFAVIGMKETRFMEAATTALVERSDMFVRGERNLMTHFKGQELANLLWSLATMNLSPGNTLEALMPYLRESCEDASGQFTATSIAQQFKRQELANMAWACAVYGNYPEELMSFLYTGLVGSPGVQQSPMYMQAIHKDFGLQMQAIMTLIYVQAEMDLRGCCQSLSLPENFPDGWNRSNSLSVSHDDHMTDDSLELTLSTSKIQRAVSAAFTRIGFDHVEEHTITMSEMAGLYDIRVPPKQMEILSIDIANIQEKIAIEVDGPAHFITRIENFGTDAFSSDTGGFSKVVNGKLEYQFAWNGKQQEMNGPTALKERLLHSLGWRVVHIPFWDWYAIGGELAAEEMFCSDILEASSDK